MSARPDVVRPFSDRVGPRSARVRCDRELYSVRNQFTALRNSRETLTTDDIVNLKREKQNLIHERSILKAKLSRYAPFNRHSKGPGRNQQVANSLERQVRTLEQLTAAKRAEIAEIVCSDRAAVVTELHEESKMLHLELLRLRRARQETGRELAEVDAQLEDARQRYSPAVLAKQARTIKALEREVAGQRIRNEQVQEKVAQMRAQRNERRSEEDDRTQKAIDGLRRRIREEQQEIAAIDQRTGEMRDAHAREMQELQSRL